MIARRGVTGPSAEVPASSPLVGRALRCDADGVEVWVGGAVRRWPLSAPTATATVRPSRSRHTAPALAIEAGDLVQLTSGGVQRLLRPAAGADAIFDRDGDLGRLLAERGLRHRSLVERALLMRQLRAFFDRRGFLEVETPAIATSPGLELHLDPVAVALRQGMAGDVVQRYLVTSPEYHCKRLLHGGLTHIYSLAKAFRSGERGRWHTPEVTMLEWYRAGAEAEAILRDLRALCRAVATKLRQHRLAADGADATTADGGVWVPARPQRLSFFAALERLGGLRAADRQGRTLPLTALREACARVGVEARPDDDEAGLLLHAFAERVEPALANRGYVEIAPWPASLASLARPLPDAPWLADRFEVYLQGVEIANGFGELVDAAEQRRRFEADLRARAVRGLPRPPIDERFLRALERGCPPSAGVALGVDRLLMVLGGYDDIEQVLAFPFERA